MGKTYTFNPIASNLDVTVKPATQVETDAGAITDKYVSPATLAGYSGGGSGATVVLKRNIALNNGAPIDLPYPVTGKYIVEDVIVTNATSDTSVVPETNISLLLYANNPILLGANFTSYDSVGPIEYLKQLFVPENYIKLLPNQGPLCFPPPCNGLYIGDASTSYNVMRLIVANAISSAINVDVYIKLLRIE